ncbi:MAG: helix-turn-helix transcriptional regulator [Ascidiaceihabitans sp.]|nr:helix-turn-helix transcriptional regulator [Ascidiaceihabitans sp.]
MADPFRNPAELRSMFGSNLRYLAKEYPSISELSRQLGINRTQFNRYLAGESFPRPDVLARICDFFDIDARVLLEPIETITSGSDPLSSLFLKDFVGTGSRDLSEETFPSGYYRFARQSFLDASQFVTCLVWVTREGSNTYIRGYETKQALASQGLPPTQDAREFRGLILQQEEGVAGVISRRNSMTCSFTYLHRVASFENNFWVGYVSRTISETPAGERAVRIVYEHLGRNLGAALKVARASGYCDASALSPFDIRLLQPNQPFR